MASPADYSVILQTFVAAFPTNDKSALASITAEQVEANGSSTSRSAFLDILLSAYAIASPHAMTIDMTTIDVSNKALATRLLHKGVLVQPYLGVEVSGDEVAWSEHLILSFDDDGKIAGCHAAFNFGGPIKADEKDVKLQSTQRTSTVPPPAAFDIEKAYQGYIFANNIQTIRSYFPTFIRDPVLNNGTSNTLEEFTKMIEGNWEALQGVQLEVKHLLVDEERQHVTADLELTAVPIKEFHGVQPSGKSVTFGEIAFYKFNGGVVEQIWVVLDLRGLE